MCNCNKINEILICEHKELKYCKTCDKVTCLVCGKEWANNYLSVPYYPGTMQTTPPYYFLGDISLPGTITCACSENNNLKNHG